VSFPPVPNRVNSDRLVALIGEAHATIADSQPWHARPQTRRFSSSSRLRLLILEIVRREAKIGENLFVWDSIPAALLEPSFRFGDRLALVPALGFIVDGSSGDRPRYGIK
jgi:hypothetical protein